MRIIEHGMLWERLWPQNESELVMRDFRFPPHTEHY